MPRLSVWMLRTALLYLATGFALGALMLFNKGVPLHPALWQLLPLHIETVLLGWTVQLALGVAHWILPRYIGGSRGGESLPWIGFGLLNLGIWLAGGGAWFGLAGLTLAGRITELAAVVVFGLRLWPRVKPPGA